MALDSFVFGQVPYDITAARAWLATEFARLSAYLEAHAAENAAHAAENAEHANAADGVNSLAVTDSRNDTDAPSHFDVKGLYLDFKLTTNTEGTDTDTYTGQAVFSPWADDSGGGVHALLFGGNGRLEHVYGTRAGGWGAPVTINQFDAVADTAATLSGTWTNFGSGFRDAGYLKSQDGIVHLRGLIEDGAVPSTAFTLPAGCRPSGTCIFITKCNAGDAEIRVDSAGVVTVQSGDPNWVSLEGVSFYADGS
jgi:hypothetical protein